MYLEGGVVKRAVGVPTDATPAFHSVFLTTDKRLVDGYDGTVLASDVDPLGQMIFAAGVWRAPLAKADGSCTYLENGTEYPSQTTGDPDGYSYSLGGTASNGATGQNLAYNNRSWGAVILDSEGLMFPILKNDGLCSWVQNDTEVLAPSGRNPVAGNLFEDGGSIFHGNDSAALAQDVKTVGASYSDGTDYRIPLEKNDGSFTYLQSGTETTATGVPSGSKPKCSSYFHTTDNRLVDGASGTELAKEVERVGRSAYNGSVERTPLTITSRTC